MKEDENKMQDNMTTDRGMLSKMAANGECPDADLPKTKK